MRIIPAAVRQGGKKPSAAIKTLDSARKIEDCPLSAEAAAGLIGQGVAKRVRVLDAIVLRSAE